MSYEDEFDQLSEEDRADLAAWKKERAAKAEAAKPPAAIDYENTPAPAEVAAQRFKEHIDAGGRESDGIALMFQTLTQAAAAGDVRAIANRDR